MFSLQLRTYAVISCTSGDGNKSLQWLVGTEWKFCGDGWGWV